MATMTSEKILIIRFSSFGDILQALSIVDNLSQNPDKSLQRQIHWAVRSDFKELLEHNPSITKIWSLNRKEGILGLFRFALSLRKERFTRVYDAHSNLRSRFLSLFLCPQSFVRRSKDRFKRFLLFYLRINRFPKGLTGFQTYIDPLKSWNVKPIIGKPQLYLSSESVQKIRSKIHFPKFIALIPSAAWELKKWPKEYWVDLIAHLKEHSVVLLGGPQDFFIKKFVTPENRDRVLDLSGQLSLLESCAAISLSQCAVGADTGLSHAADQLGIPIIFITGPTAFGLPARNSSKSLEIELPCRPCTKDGRGKCKNDVYKKCLYEIRPTDVLAQMRPYL